MKANEPYTTYLNSIASNLPSSSEIVSNINELTQCGVCYEQYDTSAHKPLCLPCGHTLCQDCITLIISSTRSVPKCPYDKTVFPSRNVNSFPCNFNYSTIIEYMSNIRNKPTPQHMISYLYSEGLYEGELLFQSNSDVPLRHGYGEMTYKNGSIYSGYWYNNSRQGKGTLTSNEQIYEGEWLYDLPHGQGKCVYKQGNVTSYEGGWLKGKCFGYGKLTYSDGTEIEAVFLGDNNISEHIKKRSPDNSIFYGKVSNNNIPDKAYEISHDGNIYYGNFIINENNALIKHGEQSVCYLNNGNTFVGDFKEGAASYGKVLFKNGDVYEGEVKGFKRNGRGVNKYNDGYVYEGMFVDDCREGEGKLVKGKYCYEGTWKRDKKEGNGFELMENGEKYCGEYRNGMKEGNGVFIFKNGDSYKGEWKRDLMDGKGIIITNEGNEIKGVFSKGKVIEKEGDVKHKNECVIW